MNIEVQRQNAGAIPQRARLYSGMLDSTMLKASEDFKELKDSYVIFITEKDFFGYGFPIYTIERCIMEIGEQFADGSHIIYVNGEYEGNDDLGKLLHDFRCKDPNEMQYSELADGVKHFKTRGGLEDMCDAVKEFAKEVAKEYAKEYAREVAIQKEIEAGISYGIEKHRIMARIRKVYALTEEQADKYYSECVVSDS